MQCDATLRSFCGQIGSHRTLPTLPHKPQNLDECKPGPRWVTLVGQLRPAAVMHAPDCTDGDRSGLHGRQSASSIYAPAVQLRARIRLADQAHTLRQRPSTVHRLSSIATRLPAIWLDHHVTLPASCRMPCRLAACGSSPSKSPRLF